MSKILDLIPGLGQLKLSATTVVYIVIGLAIAALIGFGLYEAHEIKTMEQAAGLATQKISDLNSANEDLTKQVKLAKQSSQINDSVAGDAVAQKQAAQTSSAAIATNAQTQISTIVKKYQPQGPSQAIPASEAKAESDEISGVQVNSMWKTYCQTVPAGTTGCVMILPAPTPVKNPAPDNNTPAAQAGPSA